MAQTSGCRPKRAARPMGADIGWSTLSDARDPTNVRPGTFLLAGNPYGRAVVRVAAVDADGQVHFSILPGSVAKNRHLLGTTVA